MEKYTQKQVEALARIAAADYAAACTGPTIRGRNGEKNLRGGSIEEVAMNNGITVEQAKALTIDLATATFDEMSGIALLIALKRVLSFSDNIHNINIGHLPEMCESTLRMGQCEMSVYFSKFFCRGNAFIFNITYLNVTVSLLCNFLQRSKKRLIFAVLKVKRISAAKLV